MRVESVIRRLVRCAWMTTVLCVLCAWQGRLGAAWWNGGHGWLELVEICHLSYVAGGFVKIWRKYFECVLKV